MYCAQKRKKRSRRRVFSARVLCVRLNPPRAFTNGVLLPGVSLWFSLPSLLLLLCCCCLLLKKKEKKNWCQTRKKAIFVRVFFQRKTLHTHTQKKSSLSPAGSFFVLHSGVLCFILSHEFNSDACRLLCVAMRESETSRNLKRYFKRRNAAQKNAESL